jgi:hypothetical protein
MQYLQSGLSKAGCPALYHVFYSSSNSIALRLKEAWAVVLPSTM